MPEELKENALKQIPSFAGLIIAKTIFTGKIIIEFAKVAKTLDNQKWSLQMAFDFARLGSMRIFNLKKNISHLKTSTRSFISNKKIDKFFNNNYFLEIPIDLLKANLNNIITKPQFMILCFIISRYDTEKIIAPIITNQYIADHFNIKKNTVEIQLSTLKKLGLLNPTSKENKRFLKVPLFEEILNRKTTS